MKNKIVQPTRMLDLLSLFATTKKDRLTLIKIGKLEQYILKVKQNFRENRLAKFLVKGLATFLGKNTG